MKTQRIQRLEELAQAYDVLLCDVWGVLHNGVRAWPFACEALAEARAAGLTVVLITNSPRPYGAVVQQLDMLGAGGETYDRIVTSGDVTRALISEGPRNIHFIGPDRDLALLEGIDVEIVPFEEAGIIVCTGLVDDEVEEPEEYRPLLEKAVARSLPFICANPDIVVERGDRLIYCAGALAALYEELGGETRISGKPHAPIYREALKLAEAVRGNVDRTRVIAIGDGMPTDVKGALDFGLDLLYISGGIHARDYTEGNSVNEEKLHTFLDAHQADPNYWMPRLV